MRPHQLFHPHLMVSCPARSHITNLPCLMINEPSCWQCTKLVEQMQVQEDSSQLHSSMECFHSLNLIGSFLLHQRRLYLDQLTWLTHKCGSDSVNPMSSCSSNQFSSQLVREFLFHEVIILSNTTIRWSYTSHTRWVIGGIISKKIRSTISRKDRLG